jgi:hypothetical protein
MRTSAIVALVRCGVTVTVAIGCSVAGITPGAIEERRSEFDGRLTLNMTPAHAEASLASAVRLGLIWHSELPPDTLILEVSVRTHSHFAQDLPLELNVDGEYIRPIPAESVSRAIRYRAGPEWRMDQ